WWRRPPPLGRRRPPPGPTRRAGPWRLRRRPLARDGAPQPRPRRWSTRQSGGRGGELLPWPRRRGWPQSAGSGSVRARDEYMAGAGIARSRRCELADLGEAGPQHLDHRGHGPVVVALGDDQVGVPLGGLDELEVHRTHGLEVLIQHRVLGPPPFRDVPLETAGETQVGIGVDVDLEVEPVAEVL